MRHPEIRFVLLCLLGGGGIPLGPAVAAEPVTAQILEAPLYRQPAENRAPRRVGGNARGGPASLPSIAVLAPDHLGLTVSDQPTLFWYLSAPTTARIELTLVDPDRVAPLVESVAAGDRAGIHAFRPGAYGVRLRAGVQYEWSVAVVADPAQRSRDVFAAGAIMRIDPSAPLTARLAAAGAEVQSTAYAVEGVWYDALTAMAAEISARPGDRLILERRAPALDQAGRADAAAFERRR